MAYVFLFPPDYQRLLIKEMASNVDQEVVIVERKITDHALDSKNIIRLDVEQFLPWAKGRSGDFWHCCHEAAVYFVARHRSIAGELSFDERCLDIVTKLKMHSFLDSLEIPVIKRIDLSKGELPTSFPVVVKPNFGFASTLVKRIASMNELRDYAEDYPKIKQDTLVGGYPEHLIPEMSAEEKDQLLIEPDLSSYRFFSIPFYVKKGELLAWFPVEGVQNNSDTISDFHWTGFDAPVQVSAPVTGKIERILERLASLAKTTTVFEVEMLVDEHSGEVYVLEFSPRMVGGEHTAIGGVGLWRSAGFPWD